MSFKRFLISGAILTVAALAASAQKPKLTHDVYDSWERVTGSALTPDGTILSYTITPQDGDALLVIKRTTDGKTLEIPRGYKLEVSPAADWAYCLIKPFYQATRKARIAGKKKDQLPKDSLGIINLKTLEISKTAKVKSFKTGRASMPYVAYTIDKKTILKEVASGWTDTLKHADSYFFNEQGTKLAIIFKKDKKDKKDTLTKNEIVLYNLPSRSRTSLNEGKKFYSSPSFSPDGNNLVFLASEDTVNIAKGGDRHCSIMFSDGGAAKELFAADFTLDSLVFNQNAAPHFSVSGKRIYAGMAWYKAPKDSSYVDFETAKLDIWHWDEIVTPPMKKARKDRIEKFTYPVVIELANNKISRIGKNYLEKIQHFDGGDAPYALVVDNSPYQLSSYWDSNPYNDVYTVSLSDGSKSILLQKVAGSPRLSPSGKYAIWFDAEELGWKTVNIATTEVKNITAACGTNFYDEEDDHPHYPDSYDYRPVWTEGDAYVLICDRYDVWKLAPDGSSAVCLTKGLGRQNRLQFRLQDPVKHYYTNAESKFGKVYTPSLKETLYFTVFDEVTKENGLAQYKDAKNAVPVWFKDGWDYINVTKASDAAVAVYQKGNFRNPYDLYLTTSKAGKKGYPATFKESVDKIIASGQKLTSVNPQQANYRWGDVQLVHWNAYDGRPLDGLLYVPEDIKEGEKLPLMVYFYEKRSETLYSYIAPAPSRSIVNIPFFVSQGYAVFVPDIVYTPGHPGNSAYNCICSGAEAMCAQFPFIDKSRMAIQGQSWGGYQVAFLVTRTDMFKAAGAGAPVGNMTSAYGGIRWESGLVRAMQYEHGQSRIGKSMWEEGGLDLYIENSPVFFVDKVTTPVLIMHNDADGAVPWYQGIEFFSNLRRFGKPAWLLEYNDEAHNLKERRNCKDLSRRLQEFFDHYLLGAPLPDWMKTPDPARRK